MVLNSYICKSKLTTNWPKWLKSLSIFNLKSEILEEIRGKIEVKSDGIRDFASIHVFTDQELEKFIQNVEKRVYNNIACANIKGSC